MLVTAGLGATAFFVATLVACEASGELKHQEEMAAAEVIELRRRASSRPDAVEQAMPARALELAELQDDDSPVALAAGPGVGGAAREPA